MHYRVLLGAHGFGHSFGHAFGRSYSHYHHIHHKTTVVSHGSALTATSPLAITLYVIAAIIVIIIIIVLVKACMSGKSSSWKLSESNNKYDFLLKMRDTINIEGNNYSLSIENQLISLFIKIYKLFIMNQD